MARVIGSDSALRCALSDRIWRRAARYRIGFTLPLSLSDRRSDRIGFRIRGRGLLQHAKAAKPRSYVGTCAKALERDSRWHHSLRLTDDLKALSTVALPQGAAHQSIHVI